MATEAQNHANRRNTPNSAATPNKPPIQPKLSTNYEVIITNKPNFPDDQMNVTKVLTKDYKNISNCKLCENKPKTNPIKPNLSRRSLWRSRIRGKKMLLRLTINGLRNYNGRSLAEKAGNRINSISPVGLLYFPGKSL